MITFSKNKVAFIFLALLWGCTNHQKNETSEKTVQSRFDVPLEVIESHFDSLTAVCQKAIDYLANHPGDSLFVRDHFQSKAAYHFNLIVETMENINRQYQNQEIPVDAYNTYVSNLKKFSAGFREKKNELSTRYGFAFKLHNPYVSKENPEK